MIELDKLCLVEFFSFVTVFRILWISIWIRNSVVRIRGSVSVPSKNVTDIPYTDLVACVQGCYIGRMHGGTLRDFLEPHGTPTKRLSSRVRLCKVSISCPHFCRSIVYHIVLRIQG